MFGKIVKSVFLNKEARDAMEKRDAVLRRKAEAERQSDPAPESLAEAAANAARDAGPAGALRDKANATDLDRETIREAIESAHRELIESGDLPGGSASRPQPEAQPKSKTQSKDRSAAPQRSATPAQDHDDLVKSAMLIYRQKQKVLDDLDPASKKKLRMMAKTVFGSQIKK